MPIRLYPRAHSNGRHCEERSDEPISMSGSMTGAICLVPTTGLSLSARAAPGYRSADRARHCRVAELIDRVRVHQATQA